MGPFPQMRITIMHAQLAFAIHMELMIETVLLLQIIS